MGKAIRVEDVELIRTLQDGADDDVLTAGNRRFILVEVREECHGDVVSDEEQRENRGRSPYAV